jgi:hypothetical protein
MANAVHIIISRARFDPRNRLNSIVIPDRFSQECKGRGWEFPILKIRPGCGSEVVITKKPRMTAGAWEEAILVRSVGEFPPPPGNFTVDHCCGRKFEQVPP